MYFTRSSIKTHYADEPNKYLYIDMRLTNGAPEIAYYDIAVIYEKTASLNKYNIKSWSLLGSTDGVSWDELHSVADSMSDDPDQKMKLPTQSNSWMAQDTKTTWNSAATKHNTSKLQEIASNRTGDPVPFFDDGVGPVTVANGATLKYEGAADGAPALSRVKLAAGATGSLDGFAFAEDGTFEIDAMPQGSVSVGVTLPNATGLANVANWQVKVGNVLKPNYRVKATADGFTVTKSGLMLYIR